MAKGKEALASANRRLEAAHAHIDRLTSDLADARIRARDAEKRASRLEGIEALVASASTKHDELLADALAGLQRWEKVAKEDGRRRTQAIRQFYRKVYDDLVPLPTRTSTWMDRFDLMRTRYPAIAAALSAGSVVEGSGVDLLEPGGYVKAQRALSGDERRRFQRLIGARGVLPDEYGGVGADAASVFSDLLDAKQVGFSPEEIREVLEISD